MAALAAGAAAGMSELASTAVRDVYIGLRDRVRRRLGGRQQAVQILEAERSADPQVWQARLGEDLSNAGADVDPDVLAAAQALLALTDPAGTRAGKYDVTVTNSDGVQVGDGTAHVTTSYGATAGTMTGPVTISYPGQPPVPPSAPAAQ